MDTTPATNHDVEVAAVAGAHGEVDVEPFEKIAHAGQIRSDSDEKRSDRELHAAIIES
jgi:hypothetical protein